MKIGNKLWAVAAVLLLSSIAFAVATDTFRSATGDIKIESAGGEVYVDTGDVIVREDNDVGEYSWVRTRRHAEAGTSNPTGIIALERSRGTQASPDDVAAGDELGSLQWRGYASDNFYKGFGFDAYCTGITGVHPATELRIITNDGSGGAHRWTISHGGNIVPATSNAYTVGNNSKNLAYVYVRNITSADPDMEIGASNLWASRILPKNANQDLGAVAYPWKDIFYSGGLTDTNPDAVEKELNAKGMKALDYSVHRVGDTLDISNAPLSVYGKKDGKVELDVGEGVVWAHLQIQELREEIQQLKEEIRKLTEE